MAVTDFQKKNNQESYVVADNVRDQVLECAKDFKTSWVSLGRLLFTIWQDKMYRSWGFDKFDSYVQRDVGLNKDLSMKLLKTYYFLEQEEPQYLQDDFKDTREALNVPGYDAVNVLRLAKQKRELSKDDYASLRKSIFDKGKDASEVRKDLTAILKERKEVDPDEEREHRNAAAIRKLVYSLKSFEKDMNVLKLLPDELLKETKKLAEKLEKQLT